MYSICIQLQMAHPHTSACTYAFIELDEEDPFNSNTVFDHEAFMVR